MQKVSKFQQMMQNLKKEQKKNPRQIMQNYAKLYFMHKIPSSV